MQSERRDTPTKAHTRVSRRDRRDRRVTGRQRPYEMKAPVLRNQGTPGVIGRLRGLVQTGYTWLFGSEPEIIDEPVVYEVSDEESRVSETQQETLDVKPEETPVRSPMKHAIDAPQTRYTHDLPMYASRYTDHWRKQDEDLRALTRSQLEKSTVQTQARWPPTPAVADPVTPVSVSRSVRPLVSPFSIPDRAVMSNAYRMKAADAESHYFAARKRLRSPQHTASTITKPDFGSPSPDMKRKKRDEGSKSTATARKILESLEHMSSPLHDARLANALAAPSPVALGLRFDGSSRVIPRWSRRKEAPPAASLPRLKKAEITTEMIGKERKKDDVEEKQKKNFKFDLVSAPMDTPAVSIAQATLPIDITTAAPTAPRVQNPHKTSRKSSKKRRDRGAEDPISVPEASKANTFKIDDDEDVVPLFSAPTTAPAAGTTSAFKWPAPSERKSPKIEDGFAPNADSDDEKKEEEKKTVSLFSAPTTTSAAATTSAFRWPAPSERKSPKIEDGFAPNADSDDEKKEEEKKTVSLFGAPTTTPAATTTSAFKWPVPSERKSPKIEDGFAPNADSDDEKKEEENKTVSLFGAPTTTPAAATISAFKWPDPSERKSPKIEDGFTPNADSDDEKKEEEKKAVSLFGAPTTTPVAATTSAFKWPAPSERKSPKIEDGFAPNADSDDGKKEEEKKTVSLFSAPTTAPAAGTTSAFKWPAPSERKSPKIEDGFATNADSDDEKKEEEKKTVSLFSAPSTTSAAATTSAFKWPDPSERKSPKIEDGFAPNADSDDEKKEEEKKTVSLFSAPTTTSAAATTSAFKWPAPSERKSPKIEDGFAPNADSNDEKKEEEKKTVSLFGAPTMTPAAATTSAFKWPDPSERKSPKIEDGFAPNADSDDEKKEGKVVDDTPGPFTLLQAPKDTAKAPYFGSSTLTGQSDALVVTGPTSTDKPAFNFLADKPADSNSGIFTFGSAASKPSVVPTQPVLPFNSTVKDGGMEEEVVQPSTTFGGFQPTSVGGFQASAVPEPVPAFTAPAVAQPAFQFNAAAPVFGGNQGQGFSAPAFGVGQPTTPGQFGGQAPVGQFGGMPAPAAPFTAAPSGPYGAAFGAAQPATPGTPVGGGFSVGTSGGTQSGAVKGRKFVRGRRPRGK